MNVFVVFHTHEFEDESEDIKLIGVYSSEELAKAAVARLRLRPGFSEAPDGFHVDRYRLDKDHWT